MASACGTSGLQPARQYEWAIRDAASLATPIVRITVVDGRTGQAGTRCVFSAGLIDAIMAEQQFPRTPDGYRMATALALQSPEHSFAFARPESLTRLDDHGRPPEELARGCTLIQHGRSAHWSESDAKVVAGPSFAG